MKKFYWPSEAAEERPPRVCLVCEEQIDFNFEVGIMVIRDDIPLKEAERKKKKLDINLLCSECGTNISLLNSLGFSRMIGIFSDSALEEYDFNEGVVN